MHAECPLCHGLARVRWSAATSKYRTKVTCSQCGGKLRVGAPGIVMGFLLGLVGTGIGIYLFWSGRHGGWPALVAGLVGATIGNLFGAWTFLVLEEPDSTSDQV